MKKLLAICMAAALSVSMLTGCGSKVEEAKSDAVKVIDINLTQEEYAFGVDKDQPELLDLPLNEKLSDELWAKINMK